MAVKVRREDYASHGSFIEALARSLADDVKMISGGTGIHPQWVVDAMVAVMCKKAAGMDRDRRAQSN